MIKSANKGGAIVVQSREQYLKKGLRQLTNTKFYLQQELDTTNTHKNTINSFLTTMFDKGEIDVSVYEYLRIKECRTPILYLLSKIHKGIMPPPGRPIIAAVGSHIEKLSEFVDHFLNPYAQGVESSIKDTTYFFTSLEEVKDLQPVVCWEMLFHSIR